MEFQPKAKKQIPNQPVWPLPNKWTKTFLNIRNNRWVSLKFPTGMESLVWTLWPRGGCWWILAWTLLWTSVWHTSVESSGKLLEPGPAVEQEIPVGIGVLKSRWFRLLELLSCSSFLNRFHWCQGSFIPNILCLSNKIWSLGFKCQVFGYKVVSLKNKQNHKNHTNLLICWFI